VEIYGFHSINSLIAHTPQAIKQLFFDEKRQDKRVKVLQELAGFHQIEFMLVSSKRLDELCHRAKHQGVVAVLKDDSLQLSLPQLIQRLAAQTEAVVMVLDGITDPHNLGAIIRSCECFGVDALILPKDNSAPLNATVAKVAAGALSFLPIVVVNNLARALEQLQEHDFWVAGTSLSTKSISLFEFTPAKRMVWVMGNEATGMRRLVADGCDYLISIPMYGQTQSLNVSVASGVILSYSKYLLQVQHGQPGFLATTADTTNF
jgi:23S rRNA (guanosine2251-2'-O)-methyltransferase